MRRPSLLLLLLLTTCVLSSGCETRRPPGSLGPILRFISEPPQAPLSRLDFTANTLVSDWKLRDLRLNAFWQQEKATRQVQVSQQMATVTWERDHLIFDREFGFPAEEIDRIEVVLRSRTPSSYTGNVELLWASEGQDFSPERRIQVQGGDLVGDRRLFAFRTLDSAGWQGTIDRLRVLCRLAPKAHAQLLRVSTYTETIDEESLKQHAFEGTQATLGGQLRNALPGLPNVPHERQLEIPNEAELRFAYGLEPGATAAVRFAVMAEATELFSDTVKPSAEPEWQIAKVDLHSLAGQEVKLRLEVHPEGTLDLGKGLPLWAHPEVLAPRR